LAKLKRLLSAMLSATILLGGIAMTVPNTAYAAEKKYSHELDKQAYDGNDLGANYTKEKTTFKVWAPSAEKVYLKRYTTGSDIEQGARVISNLKMLKGDNGIWYYTVFGDIKNTYYTYIVTTDGKAQETCDIYAKAVGVNGNRAMVVDLNSTDPDGWDKDKHITYDSPTDTVVWEVHVRDFSISPDSGVTDANKGKYLAFTEKGTTLNSQGVISTGIDYLKELGVTHVQLLPVFDYATIDETQDGAFNWGYDPKNYNVPEGSYSSDPYDGNVRINEFKQMIKALHDAGIGVIMDVVYNHTYTAKDSSFQKTVPDYYYRMNKDGTFSDASGCGNETASEHAMFRKYMIDSILYWIQEYHIDGFRFDLMGVHDVTTMNKIREAVDKLDGGKKIILYGEPWTGGTIGTSQATAVQSNINKLDNRIGAFNDKIRDAIKGDVFIAANTGFVQQGTNDSDVIDSIQANNTKTTTGGWTNQPSQCVSYVSAHDNYTLYDKLVLSARTDQNFTDRDDELVDMNKLTGAMYITSQGLTFMQAGEEFARTKKGDENSYKSSTSINMLSWSNVEKYRDLVSYYSGLIEIKKAFSPFRDATTGACERMVFAENNSDGLVAYTLTNTEKKLKSEWSQVALIFNSSTEEKEVTLKGDKLPSEWTIIANKTSAGVKSLGTVKGNTVKVDAGSALILVDKSSFEKINLTSDKCKVTIEYKDKATDELISSQVITGKEGGKFTTSKDESLNLRYDFDSVSGNESGTFTKADQTVTYYYNKFDGAVGKVTVKYMRAGDEAFGMAAQEIASSVTIEGREGTAYTTTVKTIDGFELDLEKLPDNTAGTFTGEELEVVYYYKTKEADKLVINYYNKNGWEKVGAYVFTLDDDDKRNVISAKSPGTEMKKSSEDGWYTLTIDASEAYCIFTNMKDPKKGIKTDKSSTGKGYSLRGTCWVDGDGVIYSGKVTAVYIGDDGKVLDKKVMTGKADGTSSYTTEAMKFDDYELVKTPANANGVYTENDIYVIYNYSEKYKVPTFAMPLVIGLSSAAVVSFAGAVIALISTRKRKAKRGS